MVVILTFIWFLIQVKRLEILLNKCKESIKNNKERNQQLMGEKDSLSERLLDRDNEIHKLKVVYGDIFCCILFLFTKSRVLEKSSVQKSTLVHFTRLANHSIVLV